MTSKKNKKAKPLEKIINYLCYLIIAFLIFHQFSHLTKTVDTMDGASDLYEKRYSFSGTFPFVGAYYLVKPHNYDPKYTYPLIVALHGANKKSHGAEALLTQEFRKAYPFFIMIPIASSNAVWMLPESSVHRKKYWLPDQMNQVLQGVIDVRSNFNINDRAIIALGHSMGAMGVIGAMQNHDVFDMGVAISAYWEPSEIGNISKPTYLFHGTLDQVTPYQNSLILYQAAQEQNVPLYLTPIENQGHRIEGIVGQNRSLWDRVMLMSIEPK